jgi:ABC-type transport system involved in multi-copper enzyme maturation permease subunit
VKSSRARPKNAVSSTKRDLAGSVLHVNPLIETWLIVLRELRKNFRSVKGIVLLLLSVLGGAGLALIYVFIEQGKKEYLKDITEAQIEQARQTGLEKFYGGVDIAKYLAPSPEALTIATYCTFWFMPLLIAIIGFDGISAEVQHRSVRFWTARSRKSSYYAGKVLGLWSTTTLMLLIMHVIVWIVLIVGGAGNASKIVGWGIRYFATVIPVAGAWTGLAVLIASQFRTPLVSLLTVCSLFFVMFVADKIGSAITLWKISNGQEGAKNWLHFVYPSAYDEMLLNPSAARWGLAVGLSALFLMVTSGTGMLIFERKDV